MTEPRDFNPADLPEGWEPITEATERHQLATELGDELPDRHLLDGRKVEPVARSTRRDDLVVWLPETGHYGVVHLTYNKEHDPRWPAVIILAGWNRLMQELHTRG